MQRPRQARLILASVAALALVAVAARLPARRCAAAGMDSLSGEPAAPQPGGCSNGQPNGSVPDGAAVAEGWQGGWSAPPPVAGAAGVD